MTFPPTRLVDGVVCAEDAQLLPYAVVDEGVLEVHAVVADQPHQLVELHLGYDLKVVQWDSYLFFVDYNMGCHVSSSPCILLNRTDQIIPLLFQVSQSRAEWWAFQPFVKS